MWKYWATFSVQSLTAVVRRNENCHEIQAYIVKQQILEIYYYTVSYNKLQKGHKNIRDWGLE